MKKTSLFFLILCLFFSRISVAQSNDDFIQGISLRYGGEVNSSFPRSKETNILFTGEWQEMYDKNQIFPLSLRLRRSMIGNNFYSGWVADIGERRSILAAGFEDGANRFVSTQEKSEICPDDCNVQIDLSDRTISLGYYVGYLGIPVGESRLFEISLSIGLVGFDYAMDINVCINTDGSGIGDGPQDECPKGSVKIDEASGRVILPMYGWRFVLFTGYWSTGIYKFFDLDVMKSPDEGLEVKLKEHDTLLMNYSQSKVELISYTFLF